MAGVEPVMESTETSARPNLLAHWALFGLLVMVGLGLSVVQLTLGDRALSDDLFAAVGFLVYAAIGGLIVIRREGHPTGWLLVLIGLAVMFADGLAGLPGVSPLLADWVASWGWALVFCLFAALTLTFPSGHLPAGSSAWARAGRAATWVLPILLVATAVTETLGGAESSSETVNPIGFLPEWLGYVALLGIVAILLGGAISLVIKRRRAVGAERAQFTLVVFAFVLLTTTVVLTFLYIFVSIGVGAGDPGNAAWGPVFVMMVLFPLSFGVAVLHYRLYEIDRIVSRTVSYALVVGLLAGAFLGVVALMSSLLPTESSDLAVAGSTLMVAALFNPLRRRVQGGVDRRFNRQRYDAQRIMDGFAVSLRDRVDPEDVMTGWVDVVSSTMQPDSVGMWVRGDDQAPAAI
jgi:uncharacterized membrane protein YhaH (DUF805 family)